MSGMLGEAANAPWRSAVPLLGDVRPPVNAIREEENSFRLLTLGPPLLAEAQFSPLETIAGRAFSTGIGPLFRRS